MLLDILVAKSTLPFGVKCYVRQNTDRDCYEVIVTTSTMPEENISSSSETLFHRGLFSRAVVAACRHDRHDFTRMVRSVVREACLGLMDLILEQQWVALGEKL